MKTNHILFALIILLVQVGSSAPKQGAMALNGGTTVRVSVDSAGDEADNQSSQPAMSANGRFVIYESGATNLVAADNNNAHDIFIRDRDSDGDGIFDEGGAVSTSRVSIDSVGNEANAPSNNAAVSANGRFVSFTSSASNLVAGDGNNHADIFVHDLTNGQTIRLSTAADGVEANGDSDYSALSADGRYIVYTSSASNLVTTDTNNLTDVFLHDRDSDGDGIFDEAGEISVTLISHNGGTQANADSFWPAISDNGQQIAFVSQADNLVADDTNSSFDVFVYGLSSGLVRRVSIAADGSEANNYSGYGDIAISENGRFIAFDSAATNLIPGDTPAFTTVYLHDRDSDENGIFDEAGTIANTRISTGINNQDSDDHAYMGDMSANGRFITFQSVANNLVPDDTNFVDDVFRYDGTTGETERVSIATEGWESNGSSYAATISNDGEQIAFMSSATNFVGLIGDTNGVPDIFVHAPAGDGLPAPVRDWQRQTVALHGWAGLHADMVLDANGRPHISYIVTDVADGDLYHSFWDGVVWHTTMVDGVADVSDATAIALDGNGHPHILYHDGRNRDLKYAVWDGTTWGTETLHTSGTVGQRVDIAIGVQYIHISYTSNNGAELRYGRHFGSIWQFESIATDVGLSGGRHSLTLDNFETPSIAYYDAAAENLKLGTRNVPNWDVVTVDSVGDVGKYPSLAFDGTNQPHISYAETDGGLRYARRVSQVWTTETILDEFNVGDYSSLALTSGNLPVISFHDENNDAMRLALFDGANWAIETVDDERAGQYGRLALDDNDTPHFVYYESGYKDLMYTTETTPWQVVPITTDQRNEMPDLVMVNGRPAVSHYRTGSPPQAVITEWDTHNWAMSPADAVTNGVYDTALRYDNNSNPHTAFYSEGTRQLRYSWHDGAAWQTEIAHTLPSGATMGADLEMLFITDTVKLVYAIAQAGNVTVTLSSRDNSGVWTQDGYTLPTAIAPPRLAADKFGNGRLGILYADNAANAVRLLDVNGGVWLSDTVATGVQVSALDFEIERRISAAGQAMDVPTAVFHDSAANRIIYSWPGDGWLASTAVSAITAVNDLSLTLAVGSYQKPRIAFIDSGNAVRLAMSDDGGGSWAQEEVVAAGGNGRLHIDIEYEDRERIVYEESNGSAGANLFHAFRTENVTNSSPADGLGGYAVDVVYNSACICLFFHMALDVCVPFLGNGSVPQRFNADVLAAPNPNLFAALTDLFQATPEGAAFADTYIQHDYELMGILVNEPDLLWDSTRTMYNLMPGLDALVSGRGSSAPITQSQMDQALDIWQRVAEQAGAELAGEINGRLSATNNLQDYVGMSYDEWAQSLGVNPPAPANAIYLPVVSK